MKNIMEFSPARPEPAANKLAAKFNSVKLRTEAEKAPLRAICAACQSNRNGRCYSAQCCGGSLPIEIILNLDTTHCPKKLF